jgi:hypothetical protein
VLVAEEVLEDVLAERLGDQLAASRSASVMSWMLSPASGGSSYSSSTPFMPAASSTANAR